MKRDDLIIIMYEMPQSLEREYEILDSISSFVVHACENGTPETIDDLFEHVPTDCVQTMFLVALLRFTFPINSHLGRWKKLRDRSIISSRRRGEDHTEVFAGLDDETAEDYNNNRAYIVEWMIGLIIRESN